MKIPYSIESEKAVIGALLLDAKSYEKVTRHLNKNSFYMEKHRLLYEAITELINEDVSPDIITLSEKLKSKGKLELAGGNRYIASILKDVATSNNVETYALIVKEKELARETIQICGQTADNITKGKKDILTEIDNIQLKISEIANERHKSDRVKSSKEVISDTQAYVNKIHNSENEIIKTGLKDLDDQIMIEPGQVIVIGARPGMGKTALALNIAENVAKTKNVLFISIEMTAVQLTLRRISGQTGYSYKQLISRSFKEEADKFLEEMKNDTSKNLIIDDRSDYTSTNLKHRLQKFVRENNIDLVIIDYLQLMQGVGKTKREQIASLSNSIKRAAKSLNITLIVVSQLNREGGDPRRDPTMKDLREAGEIEQDGDIIILINRPEEYGQSEIKFAGKTIKTKNIAKLIIAKQKNGKANNAILTTFLKNRMQFNDYSPL